MGGEGGRSIMLEAAWVGRVDLLYWKRHGRERGRFIMLEAAWVGGVDLLF